MTRDPVHAEIQKRLTLNWLIQGASQHVGMTLHHVIRGELTEVHPRLPLWYDQIALMNQLQWWRPVPVLMFGWPPRWWRQAQRLPRHPFFGHPLLARYGGILAEASRRRAVERARSKGVWRLPTTFSAQMTWLSWRLQHCEKRASEQITRAACKAASLAWGIDASRFRPQLTFGQTAVPPFASVRRISSVRAALFRAGAIAWGGVSRDAQGSLCVRATAINGYFLSKELVKGTAELICLHGLGRLDGDTYEQVIDATDRLDLEPAMLQSGGELWRRLLHASPTSINPAATLMHIARSSNDELTELLTDVIEERPEATDRLRLLGEA